VVEPESGLVACGDYGPGKLASVERVEEAILAQLSNVSGTDERPSPIFKDFHAVITAGGSVEPMDPVRAITNGSSGQMALALARQLLRSGARVTYLYGQIKSPLPEGASCMPFTTTAHLGELLAEVVPTAKLLLMAAAPGDFRVKEISKEKIHRDGEKTITLIPNPDLLASLVKAPNQIFLGFAAESSDLMERATAKLKRKNLDLIVANQAVGTAEGNAVGIGARHTHFAILGRQGVISPLATMLKDEAATRILDAVAGILSAGNKPNGKTP
jgi:phosphopantothenoylcysteine decarboxylase/phosphopantothenate--cysteine ligase